MGAPVLPSRPEGNSVDIGLASGEFELGGSRNFGNEFSKLAPASRAWRVSELAGGVGGIGFLAPLVG